MSKWEEERSSNILTVPDKGPVAGVSAAQRKELSSASKFLSVPVRPCANCLAELYLIDCGGWSGCRDALLLGDIPYR